MTTAFEQARALYGSDEHMARELFDQMEILRLDLELQRALRRRAEDDVRLRQQVIRRTNRGNDK